MSARRIATVALAAIACTVAAVVAPGAGAQEVELGPGGQVTSITARITAVLDGETVRVRTSRGRTRIVQLAGVDVPVVRKDGAVECGAMPALDSLMRRAFTKSRDTDGDGLRDTAGGSGRKVLVTTEPGAKAPRGRLWAYVEPTGTGGQFNVIQLLGGWSRLDDRDGSLAQGANLAAAQFAAQQQRAGVWGSCNGDFHVDGSVIY